MELSEEAIAIIASNLTAAHCAAATSFRNSVSHPNIGFHVANLFASYGKHVRSGEISHVKNSLPPPTAGHGEVEPGSQPAEPD